MIGLSNRDLKKVRGQRCDQASSWERVRLKEHLVGSEELKEFHLERVKLCFANEPQFRMTETQIKMDDDQQRIPLVGMIRMVAFSLGMRGMEAGVWVEVTFTKFRDAEVHNLREFVTSVLSLDQNLVLGEDA
jgi:hypothetical protein